jgi:hypothetical protein
MSRKLYILLLFVGIVVGMGGAALAIAPAGLAADCPFEVVTTGLDSPRGLDFGRGGALYIAEAWKGGDSRRIPGPLRPTCYGATGAVMRTLDGEHEHVVEGFPSISGQNSDENFSFGPHDIAIQDGQALVPIDLDATADDRGRLGEEGILYVLQIANTSLGEMFTTGQLATGSAIMVTPDGDRKVLASEGSTLPTGMTTGPDRHLYTSNCGICSRRGEVVRIPVDAGAVEDDEGGTEDDRDEEEENETKSKRTAGRGGDAGGSATDDAHRGNRKSDKADIPGRP